MAQQEYEIEGKGPYEGTSFELDTVEPQEPSRQLHGGFPRKGIDQPAEEFPVKTVFPTPRTTFGWGTHESVGEEATALGMDHALVVTTGLSNTGIVESVTNALGEADVGSSVYDGVTSNPKDFEVHEAYELQQEDGADGIVALGGGSSIDCAKGVRLVEAHDGRDITEFEGVEQAENPSNLPMIAISTTAGTGSETTIYSVISDTDEEYKMCMADLGMLNSVAIVDPALHRTMPPHLTAWTGMDALTHAMEAYVSRLGVKNNRAMAIEAIRLVAENLPQAYANGNNREARENMAWAQYLAAQAFNSGGLGIVHPMAHVLGGVYDLPHGLCNSIALPAAMEFEVPAAPGLFADVTERGFSVDTSGMTEMEAAYRAVEEVEKLKADLNVTQTWDQIGMQEEDLQKCSDYAFEDFCTEGTPRDLDPATIGELFMANYDNPWVRYDPSDEPSRVSL
jgi:methanol:N,N-dimethyl-4-nitrosoaniline oxidoreductase